MKVQFIDNKDKKTTCMLVNNMPIYMEIPYVPKKCVDHTGVYLWLFCQNENIEWEELEFPDMNDEEIRVLKILYEYMFNPIYL